MQAATARSSLSRLSQIICYLKANKVSKHESTMRTLYFHACLLYLLLNSCDINDAKQCVFLGRLLVTLKRAGFSLADVQSDVLLPHACT